jgi:oleandomycin transport system ATP-binding protein
VTVLLTTQYMEEAEQLASELTVVDRGKVIAGGGIEELKAKVGGRTLRVRPVDPLQLDPLARTLDDLGITGLATTTMDRESGALLVPVLSDEQLTAVVGAVTAQGITLSSITTELPSLDEVFLSLTGHRASAPQDATPTDERQEVAV